MVAAASFSYKIGSGGLIFPQNWQRRPHFLTKLAAAARIWFGNITGGCSDMVWILEHVQYHLFKLPESCILCLCSQHIGYLIHYFYNSKTKCDCQKWISDSYSTSQITYIWKNIYIFLMPTCALGGITAVVL